MPVANLCNQLVVKRAPNDSTMFPSRRLASPRTAPNPLCSAATPKRRFGSQGPAEAPVVAEANTDLECCALDGARRAAARDEHAPWSRAPEGRPRPLALSAVYRAVRLALLMPPVTPAISTDGCRRGRERQGSLPLPRVNAGGTNDPRHLPPLEAAWRLPPKREPPARFRRDDHRSGRPANHHLFTQPVR
jgi:hypothetical protein